MVPRLPAGFTSVADAYRRRDESLYNVIGVCTDYLPPARTRGSDMTMKLTLWDGSCADDPELGPNGMVVRFFSKNLWQFPRVDRVGDVVVIRSLKTKSMHSQWIGISGFSTKWNVISANALLDSTDPNCHDVLQREVLEGRSVDDCRQATAPTEKEKAYAKTLLQLKDPNALRGPPKSTTLAVATDVATNGVKPVPGHSKKFCLLQDLVDPREHPGHYFVDIIGEVRRVYLSNNPVEIKITDYTENPMLYEYCKKTEDTHGIRSDTAHWNGPWGRKTITLMAWDGQAEYLKSLAAEGKLKLGMTMSAQNVNLKVDRYGSTIQGHLRGLAGNSATNIKFLTTKDAENNENAKAFFRRQRDYRNEQKRNVLGLGYLGLDQQGTSPKKRQAAELTVVDEAVLRKKAKKKAKKREKYLQMQEAVTKMANQHVRCEAIEIPLTTIESILDETKLERKTPMGNPVRLPFQNCTYKSKVQVIDFFPDNLADFATPYRVSDYDALSDNEEDDKSVVSSQYARDNPDELRWEWHFFLMVRDPSPAAGTKTRDISRPVMLLQVADQDGDYLLNMEACNLRTNERDFAKLKEKLFVLWGDLEEKKTEHSKSGIELQDENISISSKPFECIIKEFGIKARTKDGRVTDNQWERAFRLSKTNIG